MMKYQIKIKGMLDESWSYWLGEVELTNREEEGARITLIYSEVHDQSALFGILNRIRDLNLPLISVIKLDERE